MWQVVFKNYFGKFISCPRCRVEKNYDLKIFFLNLNRIFYFIFIYLIVLKSGIHNVIKYFTIRLSGVNTNTQVCARCAFVLKKHTKLC